MHVSDAEVTRSTARFCSMFLSSFEAEPSLKVIGSLCSPPTNTTLSLAGSPGVHCRVRSQRMSDSYIMI